MQARQDIGVASMRDHLEAKVNWQRMIDMAPEQHVFAAQVRLFLCHTLRL